MSRPVTLTTAVMSTSIFDAEEGKRLLRVSLWAEPDDIEIVPGQPDDTATLQVVIHRAGREIYGRIDRAAWRHYLTQPDPPRAPSVPAATEGDSRVKSALFAKLPPR